MLEVFDSHGEMLGIEGLQKIVRETSVLPLREMKQGIPDGDAAWRTKALVRMISHSCWWKFLEQMANSRLRHWRG
jgi:hypothetical protein